MGIVLVIIYVLFVVINKKNAQYIFNGFAIVFAPYCIIIPLNNYYFTDFIRITDGSILIIMSGMILYEFVFYIFYSASSSQRLSYEGIQGFYDISNFDKRINYKLIESIATVIIVAGLVAVFVMYIRGGLSSITSNNFEALNLGPIGGRLIICLYPFGWLLFNNTFNDINKKKRYMILFWYC